MSRKTQPRGFVQPSFLGNFVKFNNCHRYYKINQADDKNELLHHDTKKYVEAFRTGSIVEKKAGNDFETQLLDTFTAHATDVFDLSKLTLDVVAELIPETVKQVHDLTDTSIEDIRAGDFSVGDKHATEMELLPDEDDAFELREAYTEAFLSLLLDNTETQPVELDTNGPPNISDKTPSRAPSSRQTDNPIIIYQPTFQGVIGSWRTGGDGDFLFIWEEHGDTIIRIVDAKLATEEKPHHQIQATVYAQLITDTLETDSYDALEAGIITPDPDTHLPLLRDTIPAFELTDRYTDLDQLMRASGSLAKVESETFSEAPYQLDQKCSGCPYNEACYVDTIESDDLEVLGVGQSSRQKLNNNGVTSLKKLSELMRPHKNIYDRDNFVDTAKSEYHKLASSPGVGERISTLIQDAQSLRGVFHKQDKHAFNHYDMPLYFDAPPSQLPSMWGDHSDFEKQEFVQVFLNVQDDHVQDSICGIAALVSHANSNIEESVSVLQNDVTLDRDQAKDNEKQLLTEFAKELLTTLQTVVSDIDLSDEEHDTPVMHFYTYTDREKQLLQRALASHTNPYTGRRQPTTGQTSLSQQNTNTPVNRGRQSKSGHPLAVLRDLIGDVKGADQYMISAVRPEINSRYAKKVPTIGLLNVWDRFMPDLDIDKADRATYGKYTPQDPSRLPPGESTLDITNGLSYKLFNNYVSYTVDSGDVTIHPQGTSNPDGTYSMRVRTAAQIPLGYIWAGVGEIDDDWVEKVERGSDQTLVDVYRYYDSDEKSVPIEAEDIEQTMIVMTKLLRHVERGIKRKTLVNDATEQNSDN